eukprot:766553-Hanusia_phi.AAC.2
MSMQIKETFVLSASDRSGWQPDSYPPSLSGAIAMEDSRAQVLVTKGYRAEADCAPGLLLHVFAPLPMSGGLGGSQHLRSGRIVMFATTQGSRRVNLRRCSCASLQADGPEHTGRGHDQFAPHKKSCRNNF